MSQRRVTNWRRHELGGPPDRRLLPDAIPAVARPVARATRSCRFASGMKVVHAVLLSKSGCRRKTICRRPRA
jgi:hypothetical protein